MCNNFWYDLCALQANKQKRSGAGPQQMSNLWLIWPVLCVHLDSWQERTVHSWARRPQEFKERVGSSNWGCLSEMYLSLLNLQQWPGNLSAPGFPSRMSRNITISCFSYHKLHLFLKSRHLWPQWTKTEKEVNKNYSILKMLCVQTFCAWHIYANTSKIRYEFFREASLYADSACRSPGKTLSVAPSTPNSFPAENPLCLRKILCNAKGLLHLLLSMQWGQSLFWGRSAFFFPQSLGSNLHPFQQCIYIWSLYQWTHLILR